MRESYGLEHYIQCIHPSIWMTPVRKTSHTLNMLYMVSLLSLDIISSREQFNVMRDGRESYDKEIEEFKMVMWSDRYLSIALGYIEKHGLGI